jgi:hypothetical protein
VGELRENVKRMPDLGDVKPENRPQFNFLPNTYFPHIFAPSCDFTTCAVSSKGKRLIETDSNQLFEKSFCAFRL